MKFRFTEPELSWLHDKINKLLHVAGKKDMPELASLTARMRYKFTPNASLVFLNGKEREAVKAIVAHRIKALGPTTIEEEATLLKGLWEKFQ